MKNQNTNTEDLLIKSFLKEILIERKSIVKEFTTSKTVYIKNGSMSRPFGKELEKLKLEKIDLKEISSKLVEEELIKLCWDELGPTAKTMTVYYVYDENCSFYQKPKYIRTDCEPIICKK